MSDHRFLRRLAVARLPLLARIFRSYLRTLHVEVLHADGSSQPLDQHQFGSEIYAASERDVIALATALLRTSATTLVSDGADGDWAASIVSALGSRVIRGSTLHAPAASAMLLIRALNATDGPAMIVIDGPAGPAGIAREGVAAVAAATSRPVVAVATAASRRIIFRGAWSRIYAPLPFSHVVIALERPVECGARRDRSRMTAAAATVTSLIARATERAERSIHPLVRRATSVAAG